ncbi:Phn_opern_protn, putative phosphonate metabolism protein [Rhabdaerophilaceae bacterium]
MSRRFAVYLAPEPQSHLWAFGSQWLGYDAANGLDVDQPEVAPIDKDALREATAEPRLYGFHLTLKAPFRLADGASVEMLEDTVQQLSNRHAGFGPFSLVLEARAAGPDRVFYCLVPEVRQDLLHALEADAVVAIDHLRAPLTSAEIARRRPERLNARDRGYLDRYGYPHVLEAFRPHFSLTGAIDPASALGDALRARLAPEPQLLRFVCSEVVLFEQPEAGARFVIRQRFKLSNAS